MEKTISISTKLKFSEFGVLNVERKKLNLILGFNTKISIHSGIEEIATHIKNGLYKDYHDDLYNNVKMTKEAKDLFNDPMNTAHLYSTLDEFRKER